MRILRIKSIKQMFSCFFYISLIVVIISSVLAYVFLHRSIKNAKISAVNSVCYSTDSIITEHMEAITDAEMILHEDRDVQEFMNETDSVLSEVLKVDAADSIQSTVNAKGRGLGTVLYSVGETESLLSCNVDSEEEAFINNLYMQYKDDRNSDLFIYEMDSSLYPEIYICHFKPVIFHSLKVVDSYEVGTMAVFSKVNIYELKNNITDTSVIQVKITNSETGDSFVLVDNTGGEADTKTFKTQKIGYTNWYIEANLVDIIGVDILSPFVLLSIALLVILLLYVLLLRKSIRVLVDTPVKKISNYLEEFVLSKKDSTRLETVAIEEFDGVLKYINELFDRVTDQARLVVKTQQQMYEKELFATEQTLYMNQLQINPHFLFNTLNTITQMCLAKGMEDVTDITHSIAEIFRYSTEGDYNATLDEEIYIVTKYLKIFNGRYGRDFKCELDIEDELYELEIMKMILQPIIENSFKHGGIANVEDPLIKISAYRDDEYIVISVLDNGSGIPEDKLKTINENLNIGKTKENKSIGLLNVNKRLKIYYGNESGLEIDSKYGEYTNVIIKIKDDNKAK